MEIFDKTKQEVSETECKFESIAGVVTAETTQNSNDVIIREEVLEDTLQSNMPIIKHDNYEQVSPVTTAKCKKSIDNGHYKLKEEFIFKIHSVIYCP